MEFAKSAVDWGTVPAWVAAVGTASATILVSVGLLREIKRRRLDDEKAARERLDARRQQARLVYAEYVEYERSTREIRLKVHNDSNAPIFDVALSAGAGPDRESWGPITTTPHPLNPTGVRPRDAENMALYLARDEPPIEYGWYVSIELEFTDANGYRWSRADNRRPFPIE